MLKFYVLFAVLFGANGTVMYASPGHNVTLHCFFDPSVTHLCWYKQVAGEQPQMIVSVYKLATMNTFYHQFQDSKRFAVQTGKNFYHLTISNVQESDSAMYYCANTSMTITEFYPGIFLALKDSGRRSLITQPPFESAQSGGSVTLKCIVQTGICDGEHRVYWLKKDSSDSHLGMMYTHAQSSSECGRNPWSEASEQGCVYSLTKNNVSASDAGTYHCAVALCGDVVFGKGTKVDVGVEDKWSVSLYCLAAALLLSLILNVVLIGSLCKVSRKLLHSGGPPHHSGVHDNNADSLSTDVDGQQYVSLVFKNSQSQRRLKSPMEETLYSEIKKSEIK